MIKIVSYPDDLKDIRNSDNLYRFDLIGDEFPFNIFNYYVDMKIVAYGTEDDYHIIKDDKEYLQQRIKKAIEYIETENSIDNEIEYTTRLLDILRGEDNENNNDTNNK